MSQSGIVSGMSQAFSQYQAASQVIKHQIGQ